VSQTAVHNWRKALGVTRTGNEGTARLVLAAAGQGAEAVKAREWTDGERERRRRNAVEKGLARNLVTGYHGPLWTAEGIALLGTATDEDVARRIGRTPNAVRLMRERLGIRRLAGGCWRVEELALLGTLLGAAGHAAGPGGCAAAGPVAPVGDAEALQAGHRQPVRRAQREKAMSDATDPRVIGRVPFTDGVMRDVYEDADGRQWVAGHDGEPVYGVWLLPADEPVVVEGEEKPG
jgi:hypothetical protein